jgi:ketosteroid isomerase-like protein
MKRRQFIAESAVFAAAAASVPDAFAVDAVSSVQRFIADWYSLFYMKLDKEKYRATLADDYLLLEDGEIFDADGDISYMPKPEDEYKRTDVFDFRSVKIQGESAYAIYFLKSDITDKANGKRNFKFLESAILRRHGGSWRVALLHSTRVVKA